MTKHTLTADQEVKELVEVISALDTLYEAGEDCVHPITGKTVPDSEYDQLRKRLADLDPTNDILKTPTASKLVAASKKVTHSPPMTSISKAIGSLADRTKTLDEWEANAKAELKYTGTAEDFAVQAYKHDGCAISLYYEDGKLVRAGLRPRDGIHGEDVTENVKYVEGIPTELYEHDPKEWKKPEDQCRIKPLKISCIIRGEIECKKSVFRKKNADLAAAGQKTFANPRNYATGSIRQFTDPTETGRRGISFTGYSILGLNNAPYKTEIERAKWCNQVLRIPFVQVRPLRRADLQKLEDFASQLDYEVDGVVLSVNVLEDCEQLGTHGNSPNGNPKGKLAWKFEEEKAEVTVKWIEWNVGRTGVAVPVLQFDGVDLDGTVVKQCTGHNLGFLERNEIGVGTRLKIIKSGKIIPKVHEVVGGKTQPDHPKNCPSCKTKLEIVQGQDGKHLMCNNEFCGIRAVNRLLHYVQTFGVKGLGESVVGKLYEAGLVETPDAFYTLGLKDLSKVGLSNREALLTMAAVHMIPSPSSLDDKDLEIAVFAALKDKKKIPAWQLFASLGIPGAGKSAGRALVSHFGAVDKILQAKKEELEVVEEIGTKTAEAIYTFLDKHGELVTELLKHVEPELPKTGKLTGKKIVFTGGFPQGKEALQKAVEEEGGTWASSVGKSVNYVVVGADAGSKEKKADELGIRKLTPAEFDTLLKTGTV